MAPPLRFSTISDYEQAKHLILTAREILDKTAQKPSPDSETTHSFTDTQIMTLYSQLFHNFQIRYRSRICSLRIPIDPKLLAGASITLGIYWTYKKSTREVTLDLESKIPPPLTLGDHHIIMKSDILTPLMFEPTLAKMKLRCIELFEAALERSPLPSEANISLNVRGLDGNLITESQVVIAWYGDCRVTIWEMKKSQDQKAV